MKLLYSLVTILLLSCCNTYRPSKHVKIADKITSEVAKKIEKETDLVLCGTGGGMMHEIRMMAMSFDYYNELTIEQARELLVYCVETYLSAINSSKDIKPYLQNDPFEIKNIQIRIFIYNSKHMEVPENSISVTAAINGILDYDINQSYPPGLNTIHKETYRQAVRALLETKSPRQPLTPLSSISLKEATAREKI